ncbi:hypothetical protein DERF_010473 [Dermatophagoides farinae]|uniref:Uncharacterized protein n=1 Tax=Dermatophagoides farinae TaxID=6954 RepID=A0A922L231_DERFA|nr:hypothetical protein DERF_010473 [Dermatophagoides farinae]
MVSNDNHNAIDYHINLMINVLIKIVQMIVPMVLLVNGKNERLFILLIRLPDNDNRRNPGHSANDLDGTIVNELFDRSSSIRFDNFIKLSADISTTVMIWILSIDF